MSRSHPLVLIMGLAACGGAPPVEEVRGPLAYEALAAWPDVLGLAGPGHARRVLLAGRSAGRWAALPTGSFELIAEDGLLRVHGDRVRAARSGEGVLLVRAGGQELRLPVWVGEAPAPFAQAVLDFAPGPGGGFGAERLPGVVLGGPDGGGPGSGSLDVVSLGAGGRIDLSLAPLSLYDGPGVDLLVFENPFLVGGGEVSFAEPARLSVGSPEGWRPLACAAEAFPYLGCAGVRPVLAGAARAEVDPTDPTEAGGDGFELAGLGASFDRLRLQDAGASTAAFGTAGFDLDAIALVHALPPGSVGLAAEPARLEVAAGELALLPRIDLLLEDGRRLAGLPARLSLSGAGAALEVPFVRGLRPGSLELRVEVAHHSLHLPVEVRP